jgi:L-rhamnose mutarotase
MLKIAFLMKLKPGFEEEYKKRHDEIWPELAAALREAGVSDYSIYLDTETGSLFAVQKLTENHTADALPQLPIVKKWWAFMADIMDTHADNSPISKPLTCVFHLD